MPFNCMSWKRIVIVLIISKLGFASLVFLICLSFSSFHNSYGHPSILVADLFFDIFSAFSTCCSSTLQFSWVLLGSLMICSCGAIGIPVRVVVRGIPRDFKGSINAWEGIFKLAVIIYGVIHLLRIGIIATSWRGTSDVCKKESEDECSKIDHCNGTT